MNDLKNRFNSLKKQYFQIKTTMQGYSDKQWNRTVDFWEFYKKKIEKSFEPDDDEEDFPINVILGDPDLIPGLIDFEDMEDKLKVYSDLKEIKNYMKTGYLLYISSYQTGDEAKKNVDLVKSIIKDENDGKDIEKQFNDLPEPMDYYIFFKTMESSSLVKTLPGMISVLNNYKRKKAAVELEDLLTKHEKSLNKLKKSLPVNTSEKADQVVEDTADFIKSYNNLNTGMRNHGISCSSSRCFSYSYNLKSSSLLSSFSFG